jgi:hypothetical protein
VKISVALFTYFSQSPIPSIAFAEGVVETASDTTPESELMLESLLEFDRISLSISDQVVGTFLSILQL